MIKIKYLFDNRDLAAMLLGNWKYDEESLDLFQYFRISSNAIYPFRYEGKLRLLRFAPITEKAKNNILAELEFISYLRSNQYPALKTVLSNNGEELVTANTPWGEYYAAVFDRVGGVQLDETDYDADIMHEYGKALGRLHKLSKGFDPAIKRWSHEDVLLWIKEELSELKGQESGIREAELLQSYFSKIPKTEENYGLVHYDFELDNVFYDEKTRSCNVIDFDDAMYHWYAMDIEQALDTMKEEMPEEKYMQSKDYFLEGYKSECSLTDEMLSLMPACRRFANLYSYTRILRSSAEKWDNEPKWLVDLREKLDYMLKERSADFGGRL